MKTKHNGIEIEYSESENKWVFELRGRERKVESLTEAKRIIYTPVREKDDTFKRRDAWFVGYGRIPIKVTVTSVADYRYGDHYFWIVRDGNRSKEPLHNLRADSTENTVRVNRIASLQRQIEALTTERDRVQEKLEKFKI